MFQQTDSSDESLHSYATRRLTAEHLRGINHIITGKAQARSLAEYIDAPASNEDARASQLVEDHSKQLEQFLHILGTEFGRSEVSANDVVDYLVDHYGASHSTLTTELLEEASRPSLLIATYYCMYDTETRELSSDFQNLVAAAKIYKQNSKSTFVVEEEQIPLSNVEENAKQFLSEWNTDGERKLAIERDIESSEDRAKLKLYREKRRTARQVFKFRQDGHSVPPTPSDPTIEYESEFSVDTLGMTVRNRSNSVKIEYSGDLSGWNKILDLVLEKVFEIKQGDEALIPKPYPGANHVLDTARESASELQQDDEEELIEQINRAANSLWEEIIEGFERDSDVTTDEVERAKEWYDSLALAGFRVQKDDQTNVHPTR